ncbi:MAG: 50S ribosomal protein L4 [Legionella sp.]|nr:50S ribosomal protein L4 [Legionella sp.]
MEITTKDDMTTLHLNPQIFSCDYREGLIHQAVVQFMNNARSGNSAQKTRAEVRGGGKKPWKQKGTGRARAGTIRSPIWRAGGVTFASKKRDYQQKINKKMYKYALRSLVSELHRQGNLTIVSKFECDSHKTKDFLKQMETLKFNSALIVMDYVGENEYLATRNLYHFDVCDVEAIDPLRLLQFEHVLITKEAIQHLEERLQ